MKVIVTVSGVDELRADLRAAPERMHGNVVKAAKFNAFRVRDTARRIISGHPHMPHYPLTISYDVTDRGVGRGVLEEIGPQKVGQGNLGHIYEYGIPQTAPLPHLSPALDAELPDLERGLARAAVDALEGR